MTDYKGGSLHSLDHDRELLLIYMVLISTAIALILATYSISSYPNPNISDMIPKYRWTQNPYQFVIDTAWPLCTDNKTLTYDSHANLYQCTTSNGKQTLPPL